MVLAIVIVIYFFGYDDESRVDADLIKAFLFIIAATVAFVAIMLCVTHLINKRTVRRMVR